MDMNSLAEKRAALENYGPMAQPCVFQLTNITNCWSSSLLKICKPEKILSSVAFLCCEEFNQAAHTGGAFHLVSFQDPPGPTCSFPHFWFSKELVLQTLFKQAFLGTQKQFSCGITFSGTFIF